MTSSSSPKLRASPLDWLFGVAVLLSAVLLFSVQPLVAKRILPWFGGGPGVWLTTVLFFQVALVAGYLYAHVSVRHLRPRQQLALHATLLAAAALVLLLSGLLAHDTWKPSSGRFVQLRILAILSATVGLPFVALAATAPLVQAWRGDVGRSTYRLYAVSNLGSLAALLLYPFVIEPLIGIEAQATVWSALFLLFAVLCTAAGWCAADSNRAVPVDSFHEVAPTPLARFYWLALPACASGTLLAVTNYLCQDIASLPLLWILPLAIYLFTFIVAFDHDRWYVRWFWVSAMVVVSFIACGSWRLGPDVSILWQLTIHLALLLAIGMVCHGEVARLRPSQARSTTYYLHLAVGGAVGGILVALVSPLVFADYYELPLAILIAWGLALVLLATDPRTTFIGGQRFGVWVVAVALFFGLALMAIDFYASRRQSIVASARNFFGVLRVQDAQTADGAPFRRLIHGRISHGSQFLDEHRKKEPVAYFSKSSGIGQLLSQPRQSTPRQVGILGLGIGSLAAYAQPGDQYTFYEIDPQVIQFADEHFTYLDDARQRGAAVRIVEGDGRLALEREPPQQFDVLVLDAFSGDAVPIHLLTLEAFDIYFRHLRPDGVLAVQITNKHLDLTPVLVAAAERNQLDAIVVMSEADFANAIEPAKWVLLHWRDSDHPQNRIGAPLGLSESREQVLWTDGHSSLLPLLNGH